MADPSTCSTVRAVPCAPATSVKSMRYESKMSFLATVGSCSLCGPLALWGIMHAFTGLAALEQVTLSSWTQASPKRLSDCHRTVRCHSCRCGYNRFAHDMIASPQVETSSKSFQHLQRNLGATSP